MILSGNALVKFRTSERVGPGDVRCPINMSTPRQKKDSAQPLRTRRLRGKFVFAQNSTAETPSTPRLRREKRFSKRL